MSAVGVFSLRLSVSGRSAHLPIRAPFLLSLPRSMPSNALASELRELSSRVRVSISGAVNQMQML